MENGGIQSERRSTTGIRTQLFPIRGSNRCDHIGSTKGTTLYHGVADDIVITIESGHILTIELERWMFAPERRGMKRKKTQYRCVNKYEYLRHGLKTTLVTKKRERQLEVANTRMLRFSQGQLGRIRNELGRNIFIWQNDNVQYIFIRIEWSGDCR